MTIQASRTQLKIRLCPYYRLPQLPVTSANDTAERLPVCTALGFPHVIDRARARSLCRTCDYTTCQRFLDARSSWTSITESTAREDPLTRRLANSAKWVIGIPVVITLMIVLALWITEHVLLAASMTIVW
jgi:hypothetical protein